MPFPTLQTGRERKASVQQWLKNIGVLVVN